LHEGVGAKFASTSNKLAIHKIEIVHDFRIPRVISVA
jgi:hypothetical protein